MMTWWAKKWGATQLVDMVRSLSPRSLLITAWKQAARALAPWRLPAPHITATLSAEQIIQRQKGSSDVYGNPLYWGSLHYHEQSLGLLRD